MKILSKAANRSRRNHVSANKAAGSIEETIMDCRPGHERDSSSSRVVTKVPAQVSRKINGAPLAVKAAKNDLEV